MELRVFTEPQQGATYDDLVRVAQTAEELGFGAFFRSDHYLAMGVDGSPGPTDAWVTLGALARETSTIRLGTLMTSATFRLPGPLAISVANVVFALDSIPAIFGLTQDPYIVLTANAFALMGLRQLYFLIGGMLERIVYLNVGLSVILGFIGVKLVIEALHGSHIDHLGDIPLPEIGIATSLLFILATLTVTVGASLAKTRLDARRSL